MLNSLTSSQGGAGSQGGTGGPPPSLSLYTIYQYSTPIFLDFSDVFAKISLKFLETVLWRDFSVTLRPVLCAYLFSPSLLTTSSSFSWPFKSGVFQSSVPDPMSFGFLPLMLSSMFSFLSSALTPLICGCLPHISSWGLSKEFKLSILIHTHTHTLLTCFSKPPSTYRVSHFIRWLLHLLSCPNKIKLLSASSPENPASTPIKMNSNSNIFLLLCSSSNSPISRLALQRPLPALHISGTFQSLNSSQNDTP